MEEMAYLFSEGLRLGFLEGWFDDDFAFSLKRLQ